MFPAMHHPALAATPWPAEDGGPLRQQRPHGLAGPRAGAARLAATRTDPIFVMVLLAPDDRVLVLRNTIGPGAVSWIEEVHPESLEPVGRSTDLPLGPFWPGGFAVLADGGVVVVQGRWAHRLSPDLEVEAALELPVDAPHNSFVVLDDGSLATKDLQRPGGPPSTLSILDPVTLAPRTAPVALPEASVARLSADGDDVVVVGVSALHRLSWDPSAGSLVVQPDRTVPYLVHPDQSFGWDPVVEAGATWWLDNGDHTFEQGFTMLGNGVARGPVRLWRAPFDGGPATSAEVCGRPGGAVTNPPLVDRERGIALGYDSANGVLAAFDADAGLAPRWQRELATSQHLVLFPDTGEVLANDFDREAGDSLAVLDIATGEVRARTAVGSLAQSVVFGAPGPHRDAYFLSLSTLARVTFHD
jgi:hypothetical protein